MVPPVLVAVVSWNTRDLLDKCLASLRPEAEAGRASVWVVDNASTDGSAELVAERHPWARLVAAQENLGFGRAVNTVAAQAEPGWEWIAPANADVALEPDALTALLAAGVDDDRAGALAPRLVLPDGTTQHSVYGLPSFAASAAFNLGLQRALPGLGDRMCLEGHWDPDRARTVPWAIAAFRLVRREAWEAVGGFDERQFMYAEDLDLGWRLHRAGWRTRYVPSARVRHASAAATSQAWGDDRVERWQTATYAWMLRRRGPTRTRLVAAVNVAGAAVRWLTFAALTRVWPRRYGWLRDRWRAWTRRHLVGLGRRERLDRDR